MQVAHIIPPEWMRHFRIDGYRMALAHWAVEDPQYVREIGTNATYLLMDNGAFEGEQKGDRELLLAAMRMGAHEIILPDVPGDAKMTLQKSWTALDKFEKYNVMFVPQGHTPDEWKACLDAWVGQWGNRKQMLTIGVPSLRLEDGTPIFNSKTETLKHALKYDFPIHLLGITTPRYFHDELLPIALKGNVRGVDSSTAFALGANGVLLTPHAPKIRLGNPKQYKQMSANNRRLVQLNIALLDDWITTSGSAGIRETLVRYVASRWIRSWQEGFETIENVMRACGFPKGKYLVHQRRIFSSAEYTSIPPFGREVTI